MKFKIKWEVSTDSDQETIFDTDNYTDNEEEWNSLSDEEKESLMHEAIDEDFEQKIYWIALSEEKLD